MKKLVLFVFSFIVLFTSFQILSGLISTLMYTPDIESAWNASGSLSNQVVLTGTQGPFFITLLLGLTAAVIAYFISKKFVRA